MRKRNVSVLVLIKDDKILLQKRSKTAKRFPDAWGLFGGGVEDGETPEQALSREMVEELELVTAMPTLVKEYDYEFAPRREKGKVYVFTEIYKGDKLELHEGQEMKWVHPAEALKMGLTPVYRRVIGDIVRGEISMLL